jgi:hypothetical protein
MAHPIADEIASMTPEERAAYKAAAFVARPAPSNLTAGNRIVSIIEGPAIVNGLLQFSVALWIDSGVGFELIDVSSINPIRVVNPPILIPDPGGDIERTSTDPITGTVSHVFYREDLDQALMQIAYDVTEKFEGSGGVM